MAYDKGLAQLIRELLEERAGYFEKEMFGGIGFLLHGNMACGVLHDFLIVRVGPEKYQELLELPETRLFDITGRPMKGWIMVTPEGYESDTDLASWVERGAAFALSLPPK